MLRDSSTRASSGWRCPTLSAHSRGTLLSPVPGWTLATSRSPLSDLFRSTTGVDCRSHVLFSSEDVRRPMRFQPLIADGSSSYRYREDAEKTVLRGLQTRGIFRRFARETQTDGSWSGEKAFPRGRREPRCQRCRERYHGKALIRGKMPQNTVDGG